MPFPVSVCLLQEERTPKFLEHSRNNHWGKHFCPLLRYWDCPVPLTILWETQTKWICLLTCHLVFLIFKQVYLNFIQEMTFLKIGDSFPFIQASLISFNEVCSLCYFFCFVSVCCVFLFFCFFVFFWQYSWHVEVPWPGIKPEPLQ